MLIFIALFATFVYSLAFALVFWWTFKQIFSYYKREPKAQVYDLQSYKEGKNGR